MQGAFQADGAAAIKRANARVADAAAGMALRQEPLGLLLFEHGLRRVPEADGHPVVGVHQADRDGEIDQLFSSKTARAAWNASSGTPVSDTRVTVSAQASAARSRSLKR